MKRIDLLEKDMTHLERGGQLLIGYQLKCADQFVVKAARKSSDAAQKAIPAADATAHQCRQRSGGHLHKIADNPGTAGRSDRWLSFCRNSPEYYFEIRGLQAFVADQHAANFRHRQDLTRVGRIDRPAV